MRADVKSELAAHVSGHFTVPLPFLRAPERGSPLGRRAVGVKEGDVITHVNGISAASVAGTVVFGSASRVLV